MTLGLLRARALLLIVVIILPVITTPIHTHYLPDHIRTKHLLVNKKAHIDELQTSVLYADKATIRNLELSNIRSLTNMPCSCSSFDTLTVSSLDILDPSSLTTIACNCSAFDILSVSHLEILDPTNLTTIVCPCSAFDTLSVSTLDVTDSADIGCSLTVGCNITLPDAIDAGHGIIIKDTTPFIHNYPTTTGTGDTNLFIGSNAGNFTTSATAYSVGIGSNTLSSITNGLANTAMGVNALHNITSGTANTAFGMLALATTTIGTTNTAAGYSALQATTTGFGNTGLGTATLAQVTTGSTNTAAGYGAGNNITTGSSNIALGTYSLGNPTPQALTGDNNIAIGMYAGTNITTGTNNLIIDNFNSGNLITGSNNIYINKSPIITLDESNAIRIGNNAQSNAYLAGIYGFVITGGVEVLVTFDGHLGTNLSSSRFKEQIAPIPDINTIRLLRPVQFTYTNGNGAVQYGLIAQEVAAIYPELAVYDADGSIFTIRYQSLLPLLLCSHQQYCALVDAVSSTLDTAVITAATSTAHTQELAAMITALAKRITTLETHQLPTTHGESYAT